VSLLNFDVRSFRLPHIAVLVSAVLLAQPVAVAQPAKPSPDDKATTDANGFFVHQLESPYQSGKLPVRVLVPDRLEKGKQYPVVFVLPVEMKDDAKFGNGLLEIQKHDLHNTFQAVFVAPTFSTLPWYADHPTKAELRQESHLLKAVVPLIEKNYPVRTERDGRLLLGFSKSGAGAYSLILRNPDTFGKALAFDSPLMRDTLSKGSEVFATQENFEKYCVPKLLQKHAKTFADEKRLILLGKGFLQGQHQQAHALMDKLKIAHEYREGTQRKHTWDSEWVPEAVELLLPKALPAAKPKNTKPEAKKPNVVLILADDMGYADVGCHGCKDIPTPHIDSIARNGIRFTDAYASAPWRSPSRVGLLTGRYQQRFGYEFNPTGADSPTADQAQGVGRVSRARPLLRTSGIGRREVRHGLPAGPPRFRPPPQCRRLWLHPWRLPAAVWPLPRNGDQGEGCR
jgi:hypothetical protein